MSVHEHESARAMNGSHGNNGMAQEMDDVLHRIQELTRSARQPGQLSRAQLETEAKKVTAAVQESLAKLSTQLQPKASSPNAAALETFKARLQTLVQPSGLAPQKPEEKKKLGEQMKSLKWGFIRS